jgi:hypothetical protein
MGTMKHEIQIVGGNYHVVYCLYRFSDWSRLWWQFDYFGLLVYQVWFLLFGIRNRVCYRFGICIRQCKADRLKFISLLVITGRDYFYKNI